MSRPARAPGAADPDRDGRSTSTLPPDPSHPRLEKGIRVAATALMVAIVVAAAVGLLGVRTRTSSASAPGLRVDATYAQIARPGLAVPFEVDVRFDATQPTDRTVQVSVDADYLATFDENGLSPDPDASWTDGDRVVWDLLVPAGEDRLLVGFDARVEPGVEAARRRATIRVDDDGATAEVRITTWVLP